MAAQPSLQWTARDQVRLRLAVGQRDGRLDAQPQLERLQDRSDGVVGQLNGNVVGRIVRHFWQHPFLNEFNPFADEHARVDLALVFRNGIAFRRGRRQWPDDARGVGNDGHCVLTPGRIA